METISRETWKEPKTYPEKVLQFGTGNFLRAFTDWMINEMNQKTNFNGSVVIVQSTERGKVDKLNEQGGLYTVYLQGLKGGKPVAQHEVISSVSRGLNLYRQYNEYLELAYNSDLRFIVSNTTEAGIAFDEGDDLEDRPQKSFPGKLTAFLYHRYKAFKGDLSKGMIILPCELIDRNGEELKKFVLNYANLWKLDDNFVQWIHQANTFCNSLVDRIVPGFPKDTIQEMTEEIGYKDDLLVVSEQYHLWVIEGPKWIQEEFPAKAAGLNVKFVDDITPYRTSKVRILNGAHTAMTPVAYLYGIDTVGEATQQPEIKEFIEGLIYEEIIPSLDLPRDELTAFAKDVLDRFANPYIHHYLTSIALNSMAKFKTRNLPSLLEFYNKRKELPKRLVFSLSALLDFYKGKRGSEEIKLTDDEYIIELFENLWGKYDGTTERLKEIVTSVLQYEKHWGMNLNDIPGLTEAVTNNLIKIERQGLKVALKDILCKNPNI
ncbi:tagaturonate reductase [Bacillus sp. MRMR6]|uniref:tagaturonate reductase n=1 Tax=Bacillus sp. MRMR6 TaxID=1928617 RepID=UPI000A5C3909|nr:tagaturonate reductase [Bacillus sp. MRMR6]